MPPPPPPPPPICLPFFGGSKNRRRLTYSERSATEGYSSRRSSIDRLGSNSYSPTATLTSRAEKLTFSSETESFTGAADYTDVAREVTPAHTTLKRSNTITGTTTTKETPKSSKKWGYGWGLGRKDKDKGGMSDKEMYDINNSTPPPVYNSPGSEHRSRATSHSKHTRSSQSSGQIDYNERSLHRVNSATTNGGSIRYVPPPDRGPKRSDTYKSSSTKASGRTARSGGARPALYPSESSSTLVGSALERKVRDEDPTVEKQDTTSRLEALRDLMRNHNLDY